MASTAKPATLTPTEAAIVAMYPTHAAQLLEAGNPAAYVAGPRLDEWPGERNDRERGIGGEVAGKRARITPERLAAVVARIQAERPELIGALVVAYDREKHTRGDYLTARRGTDAREQAEAAHAAAFRDLSAVLREVLRPVIRAPRGFEVSPARPMPAAVLAALAAGAYVGPLAGYDAAAVLAALQPAPEVAETAPAAAPTRAELTAEAARNGRHVGMFGPWSWSPASHAGTARLLAEHPEHRHAIYDAHQRAMIAAGDAETTLRLAGQDARSAMHAAGIAVDWDEETRDAEEAAHLAEWARDVEAGADARTAAAAIAARIAADAATRIADARAVVDQAADVIEAAAEELAPLVLVDVAPTTRRPATPARGGRTAPATVGRQLAAFVASARGRGPGRAPEAPEVLALF